MRLENKRYFHICKCTLRTAQELEMSNGQHASSLLQAIIIQLRSDVGRQSPQEQQAIAVETLAAALLVVDISLSSAWTVHALPVGELHYELTPLPNHGISVETAWDIATALRNQPQIATAEPLFIITS